MASVDPTRSYQWYFVASNLQAMGYTPDDAAQTLGAALPTIVLRSIVLELTRTAVGIGAGRPALACQLMAEMFDRDWEKQPVQGLDSDLRISVALSTAEDDLPWEKLAAFVINERFHEVPYEILQNTQLLSSLAISCARGLVWGILYPVEANEAFERDRENNRRRAPQAIEAGLDIKAEYAWPTNDDFFSQAEAAVRAYERYAGAILADLAASPGIRERLGG